MSPAPSPASPRDGGRSPGVASPGVASPGAYEALADQALRERVLGSSIGPSPADPEPRAILRHAAGRASGHERGALEDFVARSAWAQERVVALVRAARPGTKNRVAHQVAQALLGLDQGTQSCLGALALALVRGAEPASLASPKTAGTTQSLEDAWRTVERLDPSNADNATLRAACLLGLGRFEEAKKSLASTGQASRAPLIALLRRLAAVGLQHGEQNPEGLDRDTLLLVLEAFPAL